ncbi:DUF262 domain-containing protein [Bacillus sp. FJAT-29814]|uniref:DUF262 domain-containing protein n=1 Tax=Bacillus sp. FJAT-29814 TaxID=1729688 RepID=UPI000830857E|nr:DUF262 domain-containing protein [Bacillus sp. FJAT-29814]
MSFQIPITIAQAIENIENNRFLLPAIQREFEWSHEKIEWLFDSIMRDYPISSFLFWRVEGETKSSYKFYKFLREYREFYKTHNEEYDTAGLSDFTAVLDGQQRLTSLYIGLKGSYAYKNPRVRRKDTEDNIPTRKLYLNILEPLQDSEDGRMYEFKFLTTKQYEANPKKWFRVGEILNLGKSIQFNRYLDEHGLKENEFTYETLSELHEKIHTTASINYFLEKDQSLDKALNIFIRINSGGEPLSFSDLLMSIAIANWEQKDARKEIYKLVDEIRDKGFYISKDFVLKTFLFLHSKDIKFKVTNFTTENAVEFEKNWDQIKQSILEAFELVKRLGYVESTLTSKNAIIPIIYYIYHRKIHQNFSSLRQFQNDRLVIKKWLNLALVARVFGGQADSILTSIRSVFTKDISSAPIPHGILEYPADKIVALLKGSTKDMTLTDEYIDNLLLTQKDDNLAFSILALLYPNLDYQNGNFHKDHLHPISRFTKENLGNNNIPDADQPFYLHAENNNSILNLQMLDSNENMSKQDKVLKEWVETEAVKQGISINKFCENHIIPVNFLEIQDFSFFIEERRKMLNEKLKQVF